jgi:arylsulfatase A-like enzyme
MLLLALLLAAQERPHIVCVLADDLGWKDVGWHGSEIRTPNLDRLAAGGARLEQFYAQPVCSPTRAALLTGRYPIRYGLQREVIRPNARYGLSLEERTLPQALQEAGYATAMFGKWHLGSFDPAYWPTSRGFERWTGNLFGAMDYFTHVRDGKDDWYRDGKPVKEEGYATRLLAKGAVDFLRAHDSSKPLFLYLPFTATHAPHQAPEEEIEKYKDIQDRERRIKAAMTSCLDAAVGEIVAELERKGMREKTLILFSSDNGGPLKGGASDNGPYRAGKGTLYEGGVRVAALANWPGKIRAGSVVNEPLHVTDLYPTLLKLAGAPLEQPKPLDGRDAWATIAEGKPSAREEILHNVEPSRGALRRGPWKLHVQGTSTELYNIDEDPYEKKDVAAANPEKVAELRRRLDAYAAEAVAPLNGR